MLNFQRIFRAATFLLSGALYSAPLYTVTDLGNLSGRGLSSINLNASGTVVGGTTDTDGSFRGYRWTRDEGITIISVPGSSETEVWDINDSGLMVGSYKVGNDTFAFVSDGTQFTTLPSLPNTNPTQGDLAYSINSAGAIGGTAIGKRPGDGANVPYAVTWAPGGSPQPLGYYGEVFVLNDSGQALGDITSIPDIQRATLWNGGVPTVISPLPGDVLTLAGSINNLGQVVGTSGTNSPSASHAFLYSGGVITPIGQPCARPFVTDINDAGQIVGNCSNFAALFRPGQVVNLNQLIPSTGVVLNSTRAINASGQIIADGSLNGEGGHTFLLTPIPEPGSAILFIGPLVCIGLGRSRKRSSTIPLHAEPNANGSE